MLETIFTVAHGDGQPRKHRLHVGRVRRVNPLAAGSQPHCTVNGPSVHIEEPKLLCQPLGKGGFSSPGGPHDDGEIPAANSYIQVAEQLPAAGKAFTETSAL